MKLNPAGTGRHHMGQATDKSKNSKKVEDLLKDIEYLIYEIEAFKSVIYEVKYDDKPPGQNQLSILDKIRLIGYVQSHYYEELVRSVVDQKEGRDSVSREEVRKRFIQEVSAGSKQQHDAGHFLSEIIESRQRLLEQLRDLESKRWEQEVNRNDGDETDSITLHELMEEMVEFERNELKEIADRVQVMSIDREQQRQMRDQG